MYWDEAFEHNYIWVAEDDVYWEYARHAHKFEYQCNLRSTELQKSRICQKEEWCIYDQLLVEVYPNGADPWLGLFASNDTFCSNVHAVHSCPNPDYILVISGGAAYYVNAFNPNSWLPLGVFRVKSVRALPAWNCIVMWDETDASFLRADGVKWLSGRLCEDELTLYRCENDELIFNGFLGTGYGEAARCNLKTGVWKKTLDWYDK